MQDKTSFKKDFNVTSFSLNWNISFMGHKLWKTIDILNFYF